MSKKWKARQWVVAVAALGAALTGESRVETTVHLRAAARAAEPVHTAPIAFEPNVGQFAPDVRFASRGRGYTLSLTDDEAFITLRPSRVLKTRGAAARRTSQRSRLCSVCH